MAESTLRDLDAADRAADRAVVGRDPAVTALGDVLDLSALARRLASATGAPGVVTGPYLRYKPGTSCLLAARWVPDGGTPRDLLVRAYAEHALPKLDKALKHARPDEVVHLDRGAGLVVTGWAADRDLPGARLLTEPGRTTGVLAPYAGAARLLRHNPERRAVLHVEAADGPAGPDRSDRPGAKALVRLVRPAAVERTLGGYGLLAATGVRAPRVVAHDARRGIVVTQWVAGEPLDGLDAAGMLDEGGLREVGAVVAALHASAPAVPGPPPAHAVPVHSVPVHGDLSLDQLVRGPSGELWLVDGDAARWGAAEDDLGSLAASLVRAHDDVPAAAGRLAAVLAGYAGAGAPAPAPEALRRATAEHLRRRSAEPFRRREPGWPGRGDRLVTLARDLVAGAGGELGAALAGVTGRAAADGAAGRVAADGVAGRVADDGAPGGRPVPAPEPRPAARVRYAPVARGIGRVLGAGLGAEGLRLRAVVPRSADRLLVVAAGGDGRVVAGRWDANPRAAARHAARTGAQAVDVAGGGLVVQPDGLDPDLPGLADRVRSGALLVAHRSGRRGVVRDPSGTYTKVTRPGREPADVALPAGTFVTPAVVARGAGYVTTAALPGRTLHDLLRDPAVPDGVLAAAGLEIGRGLGRLHAAPSAPASAQVGMHDDAAEVAVVARWWGLAVAHGAATEASADAVVERVRATLAALPRREGVLTHRDLHDKQLLVATDIDTDTGTDTGTALRVRVGVLDLDLAAVAHPALDLANLLVHLELRVLQGGCPPARATRVARAVLDGYASSSSPPDPRALVAWAAAARARLAAVYAFRPAPDDLPDDLPDDVPGALLAGLDRPPTLVNPTLLSHLEDR